MSTALCTVLQYTWFFPRRLSRSGSLLCCYHRRPTWITTPYDY